MAKKAKKKTGARKTPARKKPAREKTGKRSAARRKPRASARVKPEPALPDDVMPVLAARGMILFPRVVLPIIVGRERSVAAVQAGIQMERPVGVVLQRDSDQEVPDVAELHPVGTSAQILRYVTAPDGTHHVIAQGEERFRVLEFVQTEPFLAARVEMIEESEPEDLPRDVEARLVNLKQAAHTWLQLLPQPPDELDSAIESASSPGALADLVATFMDVPVEEKQEVLESFDLIGRIDLVSEKLRKVTEVLSLSAELREQTRDKMEKSQREYYLREQLRTIQKELGEGASVEVQELSKQIDKAKMPREVKKEARRELARLERMPEAAAEYGMLRNYIEWLIELPWSKSSKDSIDVKRAQGILDEDHYGLEKVKKRIVEFLAVRKLKPDGKGSILCFVGPPGVGKTSLGRSIARAMNRKFTRLSLGGIHDEAEVRGHRRTYVGALPGSIIQSIKKAGTNNPVFMLDEMDKLGRGIHGDPSSAMLEVLDPEQNKDFVDHYLNVPFDLSRVFFIGTANVLDSIPGPLRDRCEVIELPGYTDEEKLEIAKRYLVRRRREENGLKEDQLTITDEAIRTIVRSYTREAGVRNLERELGAVARSIATRVAAEEVEAVTIDADDLPEILGPLRFDNEVALRTSVPGVATGLAWTPVGGDILFVEATRMPGKGELILTGQLGDVMKESARAALSLIQSHAGELGIDPAGFQDHDIHVHVPAGAIPKDGPSAGVAMYVALASLLTGRTAAKSVAMTGEISLRGLVLPIGGLKEKVLAALHAGVETVLLPKRNEKDFEEIPETAREGLEFVWIENVQQALAAALGLEAGDARGTGTGGPHASKLSASAEDDRA